MSERDTGQVEWGIEIQLDGSTRVQSVGTSERAARHALDRTPAGWSARLVRRDTGVWLDAEQPDVPPVEPTIEAAAARLIALSTWLDASNAHRDPEAVTWGRLAKLTEEAGEVVSAYIGFVGQNPRKGVTHDRDDVLSELLDVAVTALGAYEHLSGHHGRSLPDLLTKIGAVVTRAGIDPLTHPEDPAGHEDAA